MQHERESCMQVAPRALTAASGQLSPAAAAVVAESGAAPTSCTFSAAPSTAAASCFFFCHTMGTMMSCTLRRGLCLRCLPFLYTFPSARSRSARSRSLRCRSLQVWPHSQQVRCHEQMSRRGQMEPQDGPAMHACGGQHCHPTQVAPHLRASSS